MIMNTNLFSAEYDIKKIMEANLRLDVKGIRQVMAYADDFNFVSNGIRVKRNADVLLKACDDIGLAVNLGKLRSRTSSRIGRI